MNASTYKTRRGRHATPSQKSAAMAFHDPLAERREYDAQTTQAAQDAMTRDSLRALEAAGRTLGDSGEQPPVVEQHHEVADVADQYQLHDEATDVRHPLADVARYVFAGNATVTVVSKKTGKRYTFRISRAKADQTEKPKPWFVSVLNGPDNESSFAYLGCIWPSDLTALMPSKKSVFSMDAPSAKAATWFVQALQHPVELAQACEVWHEGRCGRCGRKLTVPSSIASGIGPECAKKGE